MFELGWAEIGIIGFIALLVLGPDEFIVVARKVGRFIGGLRRTASEWQNQLEHALPEDEFKKPPERPAPTPKGDGE
jgi:sec-independent protein translocase protein TatB